MFGTIRRHQSWLWLVIIVLVIISFVWYMGPSSGGPGPGGGSGVYGYVNGEPISRERLMEAYNEARLQFFLYAQAWPEDSPAARQMFDAERQVAERLVMIDKLKALGITVDDRAAAQWLARFFTNSKTGTFDPQLYQQFVSTVLKRGKISEPAFREFARHQVGLQHLMELGGLSGSLVTPAQAEQTFRRETEQLTAELAVFSSSNYLAEVQVTPEALEAFFNQEAARYRVPDKVQVSYVRFASTNYLGEADVRLAGQTNLNLQLEAMYLQRGTNAFRSPEGEPLSPEAAKEKLKEEMRDNIALALAQRDSTAFGERLLSLYEAEPSQTDHLEKLAAESGLPTGVTEPFTRFARPPGLSVGVDFAQAAFDLSTNQPMSLKPLTGQDGVYLMALKERLEGYVPPLDEVRESVTSDFRRSEARRLARAAAKQFVETARAQLKEGSDFASLCAAAGVAPMKPQPFSRRTQSLPGLGVEVTFRQLQSVASELKTGELSEVNETAEGAMVVYVAGREPASEDQVKAELAAYAEELRDTRRREALTEWFRSELDLAQVGGLPEELRSKPAR